MRLQREAERLGHAAVAQVDGLGLDRGEVLRAEGQVEEHLGQRGYRSRPGIGRIVHAGSPFPSVVVNQRIGGTRSLLQAGSSGGLTAALVAGAACAAPPPETLRRARKVDGAILPLYRVVFGSTFVAWPILGDRTAGIWESVGWITRWRSFSSA